MDSRAGLTYRPARSPDPNPPDRWLPSRLKSLVYETSVDSVETARQRDDQSCRQIRVSRSNKFDDLRRDAFTLLHRSCTWSLRAISPNLGKQLLRQKASRYSNTVSYRTYVGSNFSSYFNAPNQLLPYSPRLLARPVHVINDKLYVRSQTLVLRFSPKISNLCFVPQE